MKTEHTFIANPTTIDQINALKAVVKAFKVRFEVKKELVQSNKAEALNNIQKGMKDVELIQTGKAKGTFINDFLNV